jgi:hypothetical protein
MGALPVMGIATFCGVNSSQKQAVAASFFLIFFEVAAK